MSTSQSRVPEPILALAHERAAARAAHEWDRADAARASIEAAGWKVVDRGTDFSLYPAAPPTVEDGAIVRYGAAAAVPSVLDVPPDAPFTVELVAENWPDDLARALAGLRAHAPAGTQVVIVANGPSADQKARLAPDSPDLAPIAGREPEIIWTSSRLGHAAARNIGLRRARGSIVVLADTSVEPVGDALTPLAAALADGHQAIAGGFGIVSADLRHFAEAPAGQVDAVELYWLAARRDDLAALGQPAPLDEKFVFYRNLDIWLSLALRSGPEQAGTPHGARALELPLVRHEHRGWAALPEAERDRLSKRNFYRVLDAFRDRPDLLSGG
jgi:hypothetical protein